MIDVISNFIKSKLLKTSIKFKDKDFQIQFSDMICFLEINREFLLKF
ncbi:hypothetical protein LEP1GSC034_0946 [Leptospira interrogans str. 2003000735]|uniref:Uncharacterized protein n=2 Tax=Leptospira interrogans TaxID=173 RepID=A0A829D0F9_LEPIR|nr:hypothetical protein LEP1GSC027_2532 [Leptospira interrogans str. 2002000624]EKQ36989.1 hypothetical protein LEP1GSC025_1449 [Leptospira interrogans str. 2002000621]EKQ46571.1 hypothetical protein LEP1GSC026_1067 [Leptospira interrogans str. 2002000623]EMJ68942.1 hypothetical protein LEP1GSC034_0946 [Leptospira interrogans str. 2003000735]EMJ74247.1 hypothetical protein LEP1GSC033_3216 [Leptospira interrogans str. 2002000632]EMJ80635.1 hypothetical protein LEP1GSC032_0653 [Leptospira interr